MTQTITAYSKEDFRKWLKKNHLKENKVIIILHKRHTGKTAPTHRELLEEAICFGWIDTVIKRVDEDTFIRNFSKRNDKGKWSDNTLSYAKKLLKDGKMSPEGIRLYKLGLSRPVHDYGIPKNPDMPPEIKKALAADAIAKENFEKMAPSAKRAIYRWYLRAKLETTKEKYLKRIIDNAKNNKKLY
jgi:uncharacterized protein YdeI (YjbR/CyaY-like superfamily)